MYIKNVHVNMFVYMFMYMCIKAGPTCYVSPNFLAT